ncbi:hypothetical protein SAMN05880582_10617 [Rhizobium sp. RU20A]|uniref:ATPase inhibitor subunit zeta n=1 Tax=Rhizobium sp. RU20A TaxID=1907412 RepID=UPI000955AB0D|nr:ATPase inhibitor subunit zeta [Rhizobium sp. RU20A]SIR05579.1 hypothetical protein SAMN05880582_10617 [Rhizobium sp. RU20A]
MTAIRKRAQALETEFAYQQEFQFKAEARRNALMGLWAASAMRRQDADAYAQELAACSADGPTAAYERLRTDLALAGASVSDEDLQTRMAAVLRDVARDMHDK